MKNEPAVAVKDSPLRPISVVSLAALTLRLPVNARNFSVLLNVTVPLVVSPLTPK